MTDRIGWGGGGGEEKSFFDLHVISIISEFKALFHNPQGLLTLVRNVFHSNLRMNWRTPTMFLTSNNEDNQMGEDTLMGLIKTLSTHTED